MKETWHRHKLFRFSKHNSYNMEILVMKKTHKALGILILLLAFGGANLFSSNVQVRESDLVISEDFDVSYEVAPTAQVLDLLKEFGIDGDNVSSRSVTMAIDALSRIDFDTDDGFSYNDTWENQKDRLNYYVRSALFAARSDGYEAVYMEIGDTRWVMVPGTDDE